MKYSQTSEILFSTSSIPTRDLVMNAKWPRHIAITHVEDIVDSLVSKCDASDYDCLIINANVSIVRDVRLMGITIPALCLISGDSAMARISAIQAGADDCLGPVFSVSELIVRVESLCRRSDRQNLNGQVRENVVSISAQAQTASVNGKSVSLTRTETQILRLFLENQNRLLSSEQVSRHVWGEDFDASNNLVCVHMANLRRKMDRLPWPHPIRTIRGGGYILSPD